MKHLLLVFLISCMVGCSGMNADKPIQPDYLTHTVSHQGETLGLISAWYTGKSGNWNEIMNHNPEVDVRSIQIGQTINIPKQLVVRSKPLPKKRVKMSIPGSSPIQIATGTDYLPPSATKQPKEAKAVSKQNVNWNVVGDYVYPDER